MSTLLLRQDLGPMVVGYLLIMGSLAFGLRLVRRSASRPGDPRLPGPPRPRPAREPAAPVAPGAPAEAPAARHGLRALTRPGPGWPRLIRHVLATAGCGYLLLMIVNILYYYGVARVGGSFIISGFTGCALLIGLSLPVFLAASWLAERTGWRF